MPESVSFVIPVLNEQHGVARLLRALRAQYPTSHLIVVDGGSTDRTVATALPLCNALLLSAPGRAVQMNLGARVATTELLCFLHADSMPGVAALQLQAYIADRPLWGFCRVRLAGARRVFRVIEWCMNARSKLTGIATGDQMLFVRRDVFEQTGGFDCIPLMEDVAYCKRLRRRGRPLIIAEPVVSSARRWEANGVVKTVLLMWYLRLAYIFGVSPQRLWHYYYGR